MPLLYKPLTSCQTTYYALRSLGPATLRLHADDPPNFEEDFLRPFEFMRGFLPFSYLQPGDRAVHVGFDRTFLDKGTSHPLLEAAAVGPEGMLRAYDPDRRNIEASNAYASRHDIRQFKATRGASWNERKEIEFVFDEDWGPMSGTVEIAEQKAHGDSKAAIRRETIVAEPLDQLLLGEFPDLRIDYLALSVNGAEPEILEGAGKLLATNPGLVISLAMAFAHFSFDIRRELCDRLIAEGWTVVISNALHDPWIHRPFLWSCLYRDGSRFPEDRGLEEIDWEGARRRATEESANIARIGDEIRAHQHATRRSTWSSLKRRTRRLVGRLAPAAGHQGAD